MTSTISRLYDDYASAKKAVADLEAAGVPHKDISLVANNSDKWWSGDRKADTGLVDRDRDGKDDRAEGARTGAGIGAGLGGAAGLLAGLGMLAIPGVGPVVAAGWLAALATGAVAGGATGGIIGALTQSGVSDEDAHVYAEGVRRGGTLVSAHVPEPDKSRMEAVLDRSAVKILDRRKAYASSGWKTFDEKASPYSAEQVKKERELYRTTRM